MTVIIFIIALAVLVFVHELGHFLVAKASGIRVDEFGLGFPPKIAGFKRGETTYTLNAIPFGGFVKIFGEDPNEESIKGPDSSRSFVNKPKWIQALVLVAGISFNIIFAWLLVSIAFMIGTLAPRDYVPGAQLTNVVTTITSISSGSPAEKAQLMSGDKFVELKSGKDDLTDITADNVKLFISDHKNQKVDITLKRANDTKTIEIVPVIGVIPDSPEKAGIGIGLDDIGLLRLSFFKSFGEGARLTWYLTKSTAVGLKDFIAQIFVGKANFSQVTGPVGIAGLVGDAVKQGFSSLLLFVAFISINLAVINLIPFPALDGGRLLFVLIEKIKGSAINPKVANTMNAIGFGLLLLLMLVVTFHDIFKLFVK